MKYLTKFNENSLNKVELYDKIKRYLNTESIIMHNLPFTDKEIDIVQKYLPNGFSIELNQKGMNKPIFFRKRKAHPTGRSSVAASSMFSGREWGLICLGLYKQNDEYYVAMIWDTKEKSKAFILDQMSDVEDFLERIKKILENDWNFDKLINYLNHNNGAVM